MFLAQRYKWRLNRMPEKGLSFSSQNPNTAQLTDQLQNPPKIITGTGAGGSPLTIPEQRTLNQGLWLLLCLAAAFAEKFSGFIVPAIATGTTKLGGQRAEIRFLRVACAPGDQCLYHRAETIGLHSIAAQLLL